MSGSVKGRKAARSKDDEHFVPISRTAAPEYGLEHHIFRPKDICHSATYQNQLLEAMLEFEALPHYTALQVNDRAIRGERDRYHTHGFFYEPVEEKILSGSHNQQQGGANAFMHHHRRFRRGAWDAGKLDHQEET